MEMTDIKNLKDLIGFAAGRYGDAVYLQYKTADGIEKKTFNDLKKASDAISRMFASLKLSGAHVALTAPNCFQWVATYFGAANSGNVSVPLATNETNDMLLKLLDFGDADVFVFDKAHRELYLEAKKTLPRIKYYISIDGGVTDDGVLQFDDIVSEYAGAYTDEPDPSALAAIVFTSGTTGFPKGVMLTHTNIVSSAKGANNPLPTDNKFCCLPFQHCFSFNANIALCMLRGNTVSVNDSLENLLANIRLFKPDTIVAVPQIVKKLMNGALKYASANPEVPQNEAVKTFLGGNVVSFISGGAPLEAELNEKYNKTGITIYNGYGMTECAPIISNNSIGCSRCGSVGKPLPCLKAKIEDGEIFVKGPNVMLGYYKNKEATDAVFTPDGWLHTGDIGHFDEDGFLYITGRCKNLILLDNGENVSAEMIEAQFALEPDVQEVICYADKGVICAEMYLNRDYVRKTTEAQIEKDMVALLMRVNSRLASFQRVSGYVLRDIPFERNSSQKIKRGLTSGREMSRPAPIEPSTPSEIKVCNAVKEILMIKSVGINENFFAVGGDSLTATELSLSLNIKPQVIYDRPFLSALAEELDSSDDRRLDCIPHINEIIKETKGKGDSVTGYKCALLTGATGFLGVHILKELIDRNIRVYCLIRNEKRFHEQIAYYFSSLDLSHVRLIKGNIESDCLGLGKDEYERLAKEVDTVFHVAANVHHAGNYQDLERTNVLGTKNIIEFAKKANAVLQHTSTVSVHGSATVEQRHKNAVFDEETLDIAQRYSDNVYIHSKFCAEEAVLLARTEGLRANIYRIGNLTWRTGDGKFQKNSADNGFLRRIHAMLKLGVYCESMDTYSVDLTAVDECAKAYVALAFSGRVNEIYHMYNHNYLDIRNMFRLLEVKYRTVSIVELIETVLANTDDRDIHVYLFYMIISGRSSEIDVRNDYTVKRLDEAGFKWSVPGKKYLLAGNHCLDFEEHINQPMRETGGALTPFQKMTLGILRDAEIRDNKILSGEGSVVSLAESLKADGIKNPLLVTFYPDPEKSVLGEFISKLGKVPPVYNRFTGEPSRFNVDAAIKMYNDNGCDAVVAVGGGSVMDTAKVTALCAANPDADMDDLSTIAAKPERCVPFYIAPTTAGTGSEVTLFAVITEVDGEKKKKPFASDRFQPDTVILDPALTVSVPPAVTADTGIDALSHAVEAYVSLYASSFPEDRDYAPRACKKIFENLRTAVNEPGNIAARENMQMAAYEAGISFRRINTGYIHAIAHRLGEIYHIPHGAAIAAAFAPVLRASMPEAGTALSELAVFCGTGSENMSEHDNAISFIEAVEKLIADIGIDAHTIPFDEDDTQEIVIRAQNEAKITGYPRPFSDKELSGLINNIFC